MAVKSEVLQPIWQKCKLVQDIMVVLVSAKNDDDPIKIKGGIVLTHLDINFSNIQGQLTPQSQSGRNSNSSDKS